MVQRAVSGTIMRGGSSRGVFVEKANLPGSNEELEEFAFTALGNPDPKQIDGVGGGKVTTSKLMIVAPSDDPDIDIEYSFGQIGLDKPVIDWGGNCGNLTYAVGPFALEQGLVDPDSDDAAELVLYNDNTDVRVEQTVPLDGEGAPRYEGDFKVHGIPGTGAPVRSRFYDPGGAGTDELLPTGSTRDELDVPSIGTIDVSIVDVANPVVFVAAESVGLQGTEKPSDIGPADIERLESIRSVAAEEIGFVDDYREAGEVSPNVPMMAVIAESTSYETIDGDTVSDSEYTILARNYAMESFHYAFAITGGMCTAAAAYLPGTIVSERSTVTDERGPKIGHPSGVMSVQADVEDGEVKRTTVDRTARKVMSGSLYY